MDQRTVDWYAERTGSATASRFRDIMTMGKNGKPLKAREDYLIELVVERLTGEPVFRSWGASGQYGQSAEDYARLAYEAETGIMVREVGFIKHPDFDFVGCSPDGLIGEDGGLEIKCPTSRVHLMTLINKKMPEDHQPQVQGSMWITGRQWWDFVSYDPYMPEHLRLFVQCIQRNEEYIEQLKEEVLEFLSEVKSFINKLPKEI